LPLRRLLSKYLTPTAEFASVTDITLEFLREQGVRGLILDLDDTLVDYGRDTFSTKVRAWLESIQKDFKVCVVSNTSRQHRAQAIIEGLGIPAYARARKPRRQVLRQALVTMELNENEVMVVGDRLLTDILGGTRLGARTALIAPVSDQRRMLRLLRRLERGLLSWVAQRAHSPVSKESGS